MQCTHISQSLLSRLEKMRLAIGSRIRMKEVLIPTSSGLLRFPGISRKFTQKLYEWEKAQGIGPEASTFALLDSSYQPDLKERGKFKGKSTFIVRCTRCFDKYQIEIHS